VYEPILGLYEHFHLSRDERPGFTTLVRCKYEREKKAHGGDRKSSRQNDDLKTAQKIAQEYVNFSPFWREV